MKRLLIQVCGFNLGLVLRKLLGRGTPRGLADLSAAALTAAFSLVSGFLRLLREHVGHLLSRYRLSRLLLSDDALAIPLPGAA